MSAYMQQCKQFTKWAVIPPTTIHSHINTNQFKLIYCWFTNAGEGVELSLQFQCKDPVIKTFVYQLLYLYVGISCIMGLILITNCRVDDDLCHIDLFFQLFCSRKIAHILFLLAFRQIYVGIYWFICRRAHHHRCSPWPPNPLHLFMVSMKKVPSFCCGIVHQAIPNTPCYRGMLKEPMK